MLPKDTAREGLGCAVRPRAPTWLAWRPTGPAVPPSCGVHPAGDSRGSRNHGRSDRGSGGDEVPKRRDSPERSAPAGGRRGGLGRGGAGRERGRGRGANSGLEEGGAQAETAGGAEPKLGAERERGGVKLRLGRRDPGRNRTLKAESLVERRDLDDTGAKIGGAYSKGRGQCEVGASRVCAWSWGRAVLSKGGAWLKGRGVLEGRGPLSG